MKSIINIFLFILLFISYTFGQGSLYQAINIQSAYEKNTRDVKGIPGNDYWQNKAQYNIKVRLNPSNGQVEGKENIKYFNNSPDTLKSLVITMLGDLFKKGNPNDFGLSIAALDEGIQISKLDVGKSCYLDSKNVKRTGTNMEIHLDEFLLPQDSILLKINWTINYPAKRTVRNGNYGDSTFFIGYFYPKIAVYDDISGWDRSQYTGFSEFYGEHSDYDVFVSVPGAFKVWASGELQNPDEVFGPDFLNKWKEAKESETVYHLITKDNYLDPDITHSNDWNTWHFSAKQIPDFSFGSSDKFLWDMINVTVDEKTGRKSTMNAAYRVDSKDYYKMAELGKKILLNFSNKLPGIPYPYPEMTIFNGNSGMEYPMMCNNVSCEPLHETAGLAYHEVAHTYFPFYVGTNERKYAWMDEGWASLLPYFFMDEIAPDFDYFASRKDRYYGMAGKENEVPLITKSDLLHTRGPYRQASYNKSFFAYYYLYDLLEFETFRHALQDYMKAWASKHPIPYDFFNSFNHSTGKNLNWYWQNWFFDKNHADLAIEGFSNDELLIRNLGKLFVPVQLSISYKNGHHKIIRMDVSCWKENAEYVKIKIEDAEQVKHIELGAEDILDLDLSNNNLQGL